MAKFSRHTPRGPQVTLPKEYQDKMDEIQRLKSLGYQQIELSDHMLELYDIALLVNEACTIEYHMGCKQYSPTYMAKHKRRNYSMKHQANLDLETTYFGVLKSTHIDAKGNFVITSEDGDQSKISPKFRADFLRAKEDALVLKGKEINIVTRKTTTTKSGETKAWKTSWFTRDGSTLMYTQEMYEKSLEVERLNHELMVAKLDLETLVANHMNLNSDLRISLDGSMLSCVITGYFDAKAEADAFYVEGALTDFETGND